MKDDERSHEASSLRTFFDDQIHHLQELLGSLVSLTHDEEQQLDEDRQIIDSFVDAANSKMRAVHGFAEKLRGHVRALYNHVLHVAAEIPPPVDLNHHAFAANPLVNSLFVNTHDIDRLFQTNPEVKAYLHAHDEDQVPVVYSLLTACKSEKSTFGVGLQGNMLVCDVPQKAVNFSSHKVHIPCASRAELDSALKSYLFDRVVALLKQEMTASMSSQAFALGDKSYESRIKSLANPDVYLNTLIKHIEIPANLLSIDKTHFKLSKLGIKLENDDMQCANEFDIHELTWSDDSRNVVLQIAYSREGRNAV